MRAEMGATIAKPRRANFRPRRRSLVLWISMAVAATGLVLGAPLLIGPPCPQQIEIATGSREGAYFAFAEQYREVLAREGIELVVRPTAGSVENVALLSDERSGVSLALVQGGIPAPGGAGGIESLCSLYREPIWVFFRREHAVRRLKDLRGLRVAVGPEGSGTRAVAVELLDISGALAKASGEPPATLHPAGGGEAAAALESGNVDAAVLVVSPRSPLVQRLISDPQLKLIDFGRAAAWQRRLPYLSSVTLAEGMLDIAANLPDRDVVLLAPTANLVARGDLHAALVPLLMRAATAVHESGGFLDASGEFPSSRHVDFPLNRAARSHMKSGPSPLYRFLPFGVAVWIDRTKLMLVPLCTLLIPLLKFAPPIYRWRIRSKIYRWYRVLRDIDQKRREQGHALDADAEIDRLQTLERELGEVKVPLSYMQEFYNLRLHVAFVQRRLRKLQESAAAEMRRAA